MLGFLPTRAYRPGTPGATTFLSPLSGTFNYGWDSFGALAAVVERFVSRAKRAADKRGVAAEVVIREHLQHFTDLVGGFDFAEVVAAYWKGHETGDISLKESAIRWLRAEYSTRTDARRR